MSNPDRIDFIVLSDGRVAIVKLRHDTTDPAAPRDIPVPDGHDIKADFNLEAALNWCIQHGYTVRQWPGGARAWLGQPWIIRTRRQIQMYRQHNPCAVNLDFAFDG